MIVNVLYVDEQPLCVSCSDQEVLLVQATAAVEQKKTLILFNPLLKDLPSASGVMGVRCGCPLTWSGQKLRKIAAFCVLLPSAFVPCLDRTTAEECMEMPFTKNP